jgi:inosose dehydratase
MRVACQTITWGGVVGHPAGVTSVKDLFYLANGPDEQALRDVADAGYDGVEMFDGNLNRYAEEPERLVGLLRDCGLDLVAVYSGANFIYADALEDELSRLDAAARLGQRFGATYFTVGGGAIRSSGIRSTDYDALARCLDQVVALARRHGLEANYHPHLGTMSETSEGLDRILGLTEIALCPDLAHILAGGGDPAEVVRTYRDRITYVHFKDYADGSFLPLGEGRVDLKGVVAELRGPNEPEWWTVELDETDRTPLEAARMNRKKVEELVAGA